MERTEGESVQAELARVRARFGLDPAIPSRLLAGAWISPYGGVEEDEAEFVDALADCVSAGLSLDAAVASWASGGLASDDDEDDEDEEDDDDQPDGTDLVAAHRQPAGPPRLRVERT
jgi:hypothetical protein